MAIRAWGRVISLVMHDKEEENNVLSVETLMKKSSSVSKDDAVKPTPRNVEYDVKHNLKDATRCKEWFEAAAGKLGNCIQLLDKIRSHSHHKIRGELVESIDLIVRTCPR